VQDVVALLEAEELRGVTLVGHSYAGMVITAVAAQAAGRIAQLVYLDAFVPAAGQSLLDLVPAERAAGYRAAAASEGEGWRIAPPPPERFGVTSQRDREWVLRRMVPQPLRTFEQPVPAVGGERARRTYVSCSRPATGAFDQFAERLREDRKWTFHELATGHDAMVTAPGDVAKILMGRER
jgi:pimeloyl-ACP methyl ester carboxylesterase